MRGDEVTPRPDISRVLVVTAHPDDVDFGAAGTVATYTKAADDATVNAMSMVIVGLLLSLVIGVMLTRSLVRPLRRLVGEATMVSTGDVDLRYARFDTRSGDDITREVASAFDRMLNALRFYALQDDATTGED